VEQFAAVLREVQILVGLLLVGYFALKTKGPERIAGLGSTDRRDEPGGSIALRRTTQEGGSIRAAARAWSAAGPAAWHPRPPAPPSGTPHPRLFPLLPA